MEDPARRAVGDLMVLHATVWSVFGLLYFADDLSARFVSLATETRATLTAELMCS